MEPIFQSKVNVFYVLHMVSPLYWYYFMLLTVILHSYFAWKSVKTLKIKLNEELDRMAKMEIIINIEEPTDWVRSLVILEKPNGQIADLLRSFTCLNVHIS